MTDVSIEELNRADGATFVDVLGGVYEHSPWVAERSRSERPFDSVADLRATMEDVVEGASRTEQLALLRAHPDLGERTAMTDASEREQASAGLDELSPDQYEAFQRLNETYRETFDFPFIMAVESETPEAIRAAMAERVENTADEEFRTALDEVHEIARLRLETLVRE